MPNPAEMGRIMEDKNMQEILAKAKVLIGLNIVDINELNQLIK